MAYDLGAVARLAVTVTDPDGAPADSGNMTLTITLPNDDLVVVDPVAPAGTGSYVHDYTTTQPGRHMVRWLGTGANPTAYTDVFDVRDTAPVALVSLKAAKDQLNIEPADTSEDAELRGMITGASLAVERHLGRIVARRSFTERRTPDRCGRILLSRVPVLALTAVQTPDGSTVWAVEDLEVEPESGLVVAVAGRGLVRDVDVTYAAGLRIVPEDYHLATLIIVQHLWETQRGRMGPVMGGGDEPTYVTGKGFALPRRALELLDSPLPGVA